MRHHWCSHLNKPFKEEWRWSSEVIYCVFRYTAGDGGIQMRAKHCWRLKHSSELKQPICASLLLLWTKLGKGSFIFFHVGCGSGVEPAIFVIRRLLVQGPWSACQSVIGQDTEPQTAPDVLVGKCIAATAISVCMYELLLLVAKYLKCKCHNTEHVKLPDVCLHRMVGYSGKYLSELVLNEWNYLDIGLMCFLIIGL